MAIGPVNDMRIFTATAELDILIEGSQSLKDKRRILNSIFKRLKNKFNLALAEIDYHDLWQRSIVGIACISNSSTQSESQIDAIIRFLDEEMDLEIIDIERNII